VSAAVLHMHMQNITRSCISWKMSHELCIWGTDYKKVWPRGIFFFFTQILLTHNGRVITHMHMRNMTRSNVSWEMSHELCIWGMDYKKVWVREIHTQVQQIADWMAQDLEIVSKIWSEYQYSAHGIYIWSEYLVRVFGQSIWSEYSDQILWPNVNLIGGILVLIWSEHLVRVPVLLPWDLRLVPCKNMVLIINPMRILVRLVLSWFL